MINYMHNSQVKITQVECGTDFEEDLGENTYTFDITDRTEMDAKRNSIADAIWRDASS